MHTMRPISSLLRSTLRAPLLSNIHTTPLKSKSFTLPLLRGLSTTTTSPPTSPSSTPPSATAAQTETETKKEASPSPQSDTHDRKLSLNPTRYGGYLATRTIAMPKNMNMNGDIFGGYLMSEMDLAATIAGGRHSGSRVVTVAVDKIIFKHPVHVGNTVSCYTWIKHTGRTSMSIKVLVICKDEVRHTVNEVTEGFFTMVAIDDDGKPKKIVEKNAREKSEKKSVVLVCE